MDFEVAELLLATFQPRFDVYAERWDDQQAVDRYNAWLEKQEFKAAPAVIGGYKPAGPVSDRKPLTPEVVVEHIHGRKTVGVYPLFDGALCNIVAADFDNHRGDTTLAADPAADYRALASILDDSDIPYLGWHSRGGKGFWLALLPPLATPAKDARAVLHGLLELAGVKKVQEGGTFDDLFPKQDALPFDPENPTKNLGNLFALPLSRRWAPGSMFVGVDASDWNAQVEHLRNATRIDPEMWSALVQEFPPKAKAATLRTSTGPFQPTGVRSAWERLLSATGRLGRDLGAGKFAVLCINDSQHSNPDQFVENSNGSCFLHPPSTLKNLGWPHCSHAHCNELGLRDWLKASADTLMELARKSPDPAQAIYDQAEAWASLNAIDPMFFVSFKKALKTLSKTFSWLDLQRLMKEFKPQLNASRVWNGYPLNDVGNAQRFVDENHETLRYEPRTDRWLVWSGSCWEPEYGASESCARAQTLSYKMLEEAQTSEDQKQRNFLIKHAIYTGSNSGQKAILALAKGITKILFPIDTSEDPFLFNCDNGTIDLRTGVLQPHDKQQFMLSKSDVRYDLDAECPRWTQFLNEVMPDESMQRYLQKLIGYGLTGAVKEHVLPVFWGELGGNGKSTFIGVISKLLGPYFRTIPKDVLTVHRGGGSRHPTELTLLEGARLVVASETDQDDAFDQSLVKRLTGGDQITARKMRQDFYTFSPTHKVILVTNPRPRIKGDDQALKRRAHLIPWEASFYDPGNVIQDNGAGIADENLPEKLAAELSGVLNWALLGCLDWQSEGLALPLQAREATEGYFEDEDALGEFFAQKCRFEKDRKKAPELRVTRSELWSVYNMWCRLTDQKPLSNRSFAQRVRSHLRKVYGRRFKPDIWYRESGSETSLRAWSGIHADRLMTVPSANGPRP